MRLLYYTSIAHHTAHPASFSPAVRNSSSRTYYLPWCVSIPRLFLPHHSFITSYSSYLLCSPLTSIPHKSCPSPTTTHTFPPPFSPPSTTLLVSLPLFLACCHPRLPHSPIFPISSSPHLPLLVGQGCSAASYTLITSLCTSLHYLTLLIHYNDTIYICSTYNTSFISRQCN